MCIYFKLYLKFDADNDITLMQISGVIHAISARTMAKNQLKVIENVFIFLLVRLQTWVAYNKKK